MRSSKWSNWAGTYTCTPSHFVKVHSELEILQIIKQASLLKKKIRVVGSGHSPSDIVCTADIMLDISAFNKIVNVDSKSNLVTVQAGIVLHELNQKLDELGLALDILGSISDQTLAGSISTCTHGTGASFSLMADMIHTFKFITSDGGIHQVTRENPPLFKALQCSLGCLGIITEITIKAVPKFNLSVQQNPLKFTDMLNNFTTLSRSSDHVRFFWFPHTSRKENNDDDCIIWSAERIITKTNTQQPEQTLTQKIRTWVDDRLIGHHIYELSLYAASFSPNLLPYINRKYFGKYFADPVNITDKSFSLFNFDCLFKQYTTEWAVNIEQATGALNELNAYLRGSRIKVHGPIEIRFAKEDDIWLSPAYEQNVCFIGIIMFRPFKTDVPYIKSYWQGYENIMMRHGGRPHWGKAFDLTPRELSVLFPRFNAFRDLREKLDPEGMFTNEYIDRHILGVMKSRL